MEFIVFLWTNFLVGFFSFGGGRAFIPIYQQVFVEQYGIINFTRLMELVGYSSALPGPIAPMVSGVIGYEKYGILGVIFGIIALIIPAVVAFFIFWKLFKKYENTRSLKSIAKYMSPAIIALLLGVILETFIVSYANKETFYLEYSIVAFLVASFLFIKYHLHPFLMIILGGFVGFFVL